MWKRSGHFMPLSSRRQRKEKFSSLFYTFLQFPALFSFVRGEDKSARRTRRPWKI